MATELVLSGVKFPDGTVQSTAAVTATTTPGWNVTYLECTCKLFGCLRLLLYLGWFQQRW